MSLDWDELLGSWDRMQDGYLGDREERLDVLVRAAATRGPAPRVLDLACGPGSISWRLLDRLPDCRVVALDVDPILLRILEHRRGDDQRVTVVTADLRDPSWSSALAGRFDAVVTATALHWLHAEQLFRVYAEVRELLGGGGGGSSAGDLGGDASGGTGGVFANADHFPVDEGLRPVADAARAVRHAGAESWETWWAHVLALPEMADLVERRAALFGGELHSAELEASASWHRERLLEAGFAAAGEVWRRGRDAVMVGVAQ